MGAASPVGWREGYVVGVWVLVELLRWFLMAKIKVYLQRRDIHFFVEELA
jgi:hypothetical protein